MLSRSEAVRYCHKPHKTQAVIISISDPNMLCGTNEIGEATAEKMKTARLVVWAQHGIYGAGRDLDETFGLIETAEKAAEVYLKIAHLPWKQTIADNALHQLEQRFGVKARDGYLD